MRIDTVLFDMDGTLLDTLGDLHASVSYALERAGLPPVSRDETRLAAGYASVVLIDRLTGHAYPTDSDEFEAVWTDFVEHYREHSNQTTKPYAGIQPLLAALSARGIKMGIVSNKIHDDTDALRGLWFGEHIPVAVGFSSERPKKPAPDMVFAALQELGSSPEHAIYVGDSEPDVQIAQNSGCTSVAVTWGFRTRDTLAALGPDFMIDAPEELLGVIDSIETGAGAA